MNRRDFLRSTAAAGAAAVATPLAIAAAAPVYEELPRGTYGRFELSSAPRPTIDDPLAQGVIFGTGMPTILREQQREYDAEIRRTLEDYSRTFRIPNGTW